KDQEGCERDLDRAIKMTKGRPESYLELGWLRLEQNRLDQALEYAERARSPLFVRPEMEGALCALRGFVFSRLGRADEARVAFDRFIELRPNDPLPPVHRGCGDHI